MEGIDAAVFVEKSSLLRSGQGRIDLTNRHVGVASDDRGSQVSQNESDREDGLPLPVPTGDRRAP
jgi:hypothetical protein